MEQHFATARAALAALSPLTVAAAQTELATANGALVRFQETHKQIVALSRTNSNVYSLELALGKGRSLIEACDASLSNLQDVLTKAGFKATR